MALSTTDELFDAVQNLMGGMSDRASSDIFDQAIEHTNRELPWFVPETDDTKCYWLIERCRRHVLMALCVESAAKFQYKQIHLEQRFKQIFALIEFIDKRFQDFIDENPSLFPPSTLDNAYANISYIGNGFVYDSIGRSLT